MLVGVACLAVVLAVVRHYVEGYRRQFAAAARIEAAGGDVYAEASRFSYWLREWGVAKFGDVYLIRLPVETITSPQMLEDLARFPDITELEIHTDGRAPRADSSFVAMDGALLSRFPNLKEIELEGVRPEGDFFTSLGALAKLETLMLNECDVDDRIFAALPSMRSLSALIILKSPIRGEGLASLIPLPPLEWLDLRDTEVDDEALRGVGQLTRLKFLFLTNTSVTDAGLQHLKQLRQLDELYLDGTAVRGPGLTHLEKLPLTLLVLDRTEVESEHFATVARIRTLMGLSLENMPNLSDDGLEHLARMENLVLLLLQGAVVGDAGMASLAKASQLVRLDLSGTHVTDEGLRHVAGITTLVSLRLTNTQVTDVGLQYLETMPDLVELSLDGTAVSEEAAYEFRWKVIKRLQSQLAEEP